MPQPTEALAGSVEFRGIDYPTYRLAILVAVFGIAGLVWLVLKRTNVGLVVRLRRAGYEAVGRLAASVAIGPIADRRDHHRPRVLTAQQLRRVVLFGMVIICSGLGQRCR